MNNYVLIYRFVKESVQEVFTDFVKSKYAPYKMDKDDGFEFVTFVSGSLPQVEDELNDKINELEIGGEDYAALYYTRETNPDSIKRIMLLGPGSFMEMDLNAMSASEHEKALNELVNF